MRRKTILRQSAGPLLFFSVFLQTTLAGNDFVLIEDRKPAAMFVVTKDQEKRSGLTKGFSISKDSIKDFNADLKECTNGAGLSVTDKDDGKTPAIRFSLKSSPLSDEDRFSITFPDSRTMLITGTPLSIRWALNHILEKFAGIRYLARSRNGAYFPPLTNVRLPREKIEKAPSFYLRRDLFYPDHEYWFKRSYSKSGIPINHELSVVAFPVKKYMKEKKWPEFIFPIKNGKKFLPYLPGNNPLFKKPYQYAIGWQPCMTNQATIDEAVKNICAYFGKYPERTSVSLSVNDCAGFCECENCRKFQKDILYYRWINQIAEAVAKKHPDKYFGCLAYCEVMTPPPFKLHKNIVPFLCFESFACMDKEVKEARIKLLESWSKKANRLGRWEYSMNMHYTLPKVAFSLQQEMLKIAYDNNVRGMFVEAEGAVEDGPTRYLLRKLMWDIHADCKSLQQDWYEKFTCKEAAPYLAEYYQWWETFWRERGTKSEWFQSSKKAVYLNIGNKSYMYGIERGDMEKLRLLMEKVVFLSNRYGNKRQKIRAKWLMREFEYCEACVYALGADIFSSDNVSEKNVEEALEYLKNISKALKYEARRIELIKERAKDPDFGRSYKNIKTSSRYVVEAISKISSVAQNPKVQKAFTALAKKDSIPMDIRGLLRVLKKLRNNEFVENLQPNGSFENGTRSGWKGNGEINSEKAYSGKYSMK
ncbi:MAG: DUF4838 domain-containing protein, partial [Victivallaceae bacterium]|nr:DUF4838 domain-containing protein [Victivallaceae bacterium]